MQCMLPLFMTCLAASALSLPTAAAVAMATDEEQDPQRPFITDVFSHRGAYRQQIDLRGPWSFRRDPDNQGHVSGWHRGEGEFTDTVTIPGPPQAQGFGDPHVFQRTAFAGPFWLRRTFDVPRLCQDHRLWLRLGGVLPAAEIYVNGKSVGFTKSSRTQQRVDITGFVKDDAENGITIKVCDFPEVRLDGLLEWNEGTQLWRGVYRSVACEVAHRLSIVDCYVQPRLARGAADVEVALTEPANAPLIATVEVKDGKRCLGKDRIEIGKGKDRFATEVRLQEFTPWSPEHPKLYTLDIALFDGGDAQPIDRVPVRFGMREITTKGTKFYLNGKPIFLRVYGEDHYYPDTLSPPADIEWYRPRLKRARQYGLNAVKGCVETIPQDYLEAADEAGIMVIQEMPFGLSTLRANRHDISGPFRSYYVEELNGLVRVSRNHAAVIAYSMSSELEFDLQTQESFDFFSRELPRQTRLLAPHALVIDCTGYVNSEETTKGRRDTDFYASVHPKWQKEVLDESDMQTDGRHPMILHEYNWWSCYPDPADKAKYAGAQLKPFWLDSLVETAWKNGQGELIPTYRKNSLWLQTLCRKDGLEYARRTPGAEGFILWLLVDFGHWSEGLFDDFWNPKNVSAAEFLQSNGDTVILLAKEGNRCVEVGVTARIPLAVSHYGERGISGAALDWEVTGGGARHEGSIPLPELPEGELTQAGSAVWEPVAVDKAYQLTLRVALRHDGQSVNTNAWSFWAFPQLPGRSPTGDASWPEKAGNVVPHGVLLRTGPARDAAIPQDTRLVIADAVDATLADYIQAGGRCILNSRGAVIENRQDNFGIFRTIPWNRGTSGNSGTVISDHPAMALFPHEGPRHLPFVPLISGYRPMEFESLRPYGVTPIIRCIDHYVANRNNAYMLEFRVGKGSVLATSLGILDQLSKHVQARYLLHCLVDYARGLKLEPPAAVPRDEFLRLFQSRTDGEAACVPKATWALATQSWHSRGRKPHLPGRRSDTAPSVPWAFPGGDRHRSWCCSLATARQ